MILKAVAIPLTPILWLTLLEHFHSLCKDGKFYREEKYFKKCELCFIKTRMEDTSMVQPLQPDVPVWQVKNKQKKP